MTNEQIKELALAYGFKLREQSDGNMDLNPYVYDFARVVFARQHSDWIPVSELPKEEKDWLVRFRKEDGFGLTMAVSKFYLEAQRFDCFHSKVTHYMELPKPPSEVQE